MTPILLEERAQILARIIHDGFYGTRRYAAATRWPPVSRGQLGGLASSGPGPGLCRPVQFTMLVGHMTDGNILPVLAGLGIMLALAIRYWFRRRQAAKLADQLLDEVVKGKDAFRR